MKAHRLVGLGCVSAVALLALACGGSSEQESKTAHDELDTSDEDALLAEERSSDSEMAHRAPHRTRKTDDDDDSEREMASGKDESAEPEFPENASVEDAIKAIPAGADRLNLDQERLAQPLQNPAVYEPCKAGNEHFTMKIAVYNGRAVGIDIKAKNEKLAACLREELKKVEWPDKVKSLNTIEYGL